MHKKFEINWTKIKGGYQSGRKVVTHNSKSDLPLVSFGGEALRNTSRECPLREKSWSSVTPEGCKCLGPPFFQKARAAPSNLQGNAWHAKDTFLYLNCKMHSPALFENFMVIPTLVYY